MMTLFLEQVRRGAPITIEGDGSHTRDFVHVDDVTRAFALAAGSHRPGIYNVGGGSTISIMELADLVGGPNYRRILLPRRRGDIPHSVAAVHAIREAFGFQTHVSLADGLDRLRS